MFEINVSERLKHFQTGVFADLNEKQIELRNNNRKVYNFSVGTPDFEPDACIMERLSNEALKPENYKYSLRDIPELLDAVIEYYKKRFGVELSRDEITAVHGTQEGMGHLGMALISEGDAAILPNPGYPVFEAGAYLAGADIYYYELKQENNYQPDFSAIPEDVARKAKYMVISYPYNPVCASATEETYVKAIEFANKYNIIIIHDNAYSDIIYSRKKGKSFLQYEGAKEVGAEFFSLSKSFNVTGCRISFLIGNKKIIDALKLLRSQIDFGIFLPVQYAAIEALKSDSSKVEKQCDKYKRRMMLLCDSFRKIGWNIPYSQGTMFVWAPLPDGYENSKEFCMELMEKAGVVCTPGSAFGSLGEGYVRFALVLEDEEVIAAVNAVEQSGIINKKYSIL